MATIQIYVPEELKTAVENEAALQDRSISYVVRQWIKDALDKSKSKPSPDTQSEK